MPAAVRAAIDACGARLRPGDQVDPERPVRGRDAPQRRHAGRAVFADDGTLARVGRQPRAPRRPRRDGARIDARPTPRRSTRRGCGSRPCVCTPDVEAIFVAASRTPEERRGDLDAQRGANRLGVARLRALGAEPFAEIVAYGERRMRAALARVARRTLRVRGRPRLDGWSRAGQSRPARIQVAVTVDGDAITFDFTGTDAQRAGTVNAVEAVTVSAVAFAVRSRHGSRRSRRTAARCGRCTCSRPRARSLPRVPPVAVGAGNVEVSQRVADVCLGALAQAAPDRRRAPRRKAR